VYFFYFVRAFTKSQHNLELILFREGHIFGFFGDLDVCAVDRFSMQINQTIQWKTHRYLSSFVFSSCVWAMIVFLLTLVTWSEDRVENPRVPFFSFSLLSLLPATLLAQSLRVVSSSSTCPGSNGIGTHSLALLSCHSGNASLCSSCPIAVLNIYFFQGTEAHMRFSLLSRSSWGIQLVAVKRTMGSFIFLHLSCILESSCG